VRAAGCAAVLLAAAAAPLAAQSAATAAALLEIAGTPRALALQGAYASLVGDEGSIFVNPAGMAPVHHIALGVSAAQGLLGDRHSTVAFVMRLGRHWDVGLGAVFLDLGGDSVVVPDLASGGTTGTTTGQLISAWDGLAVASVAYRRGMLSLGASVKALHEQLGSGTTGWRATSVAGDLGFAVAVFDLFSFGAVLQNVGGAAHAADGGPAALPRTGRIGFTLNFIDPQGTARLMATTDWVKPPGDDSYWAFGFEGGVVANGLGFLGRCGVSAGRTATDRRGYSLGAGLVVRSLRVDYAWQPYGALRAAEQRVGVAWIP
jgi:hypothetical protein